MHQRICPVKRTRQTQSVTCDMLHMLTLSQIMFAYIPLDGRCSIFQFIVGDRSVIFVREFPARQENVLQDVRFVTLISFLNSRPFCVASPQKACPFGASSSIRQRAHSISAIRKS